VSRPRFSILITARNEEELLQRTVESVLVHAPPDDHEIVVVDDASNRPAMVALEGVLRTSKSIRVFRNEARLGLIRSRAIAAHEARGEYLAFLDAHCAVSRGWLEGLAEAVTSLPRGGGIAVPSVHGLDAETWQMHDSAPPIQASSIINPFMDFGWVEPLSLEGRPCTCTLGGMAWLVARDWYEHVGGLDEEMIGWGGENLDVALRTWIAGGWCVVVPEVSVGHLFRLEAKDPIPAEELAYNKLRAAHTIFSQRTFTRILGNLLSFKPYQIALEKLRASPIGLGRIKARVESIRQRADRWTIDTFRLPVVEAPFFYLQPDHSRHVASGDGAQDVPTRDRPLVQVFLRASANATETRASLSSLLEHTAYTNLEVVLLASGEGTVNGLEEFQTHPRLRTLHAEPGWSPGEEAALASLASLAEYCAFASAGAVVLDRYWVEKLVLLFDRRPKLVLASPCLLLRSAGTSSEVNTFELIWDWNSPCFSRPRAGSPLSRSSYQVLAGSEGFTFVRRDAFLQLGGFDGTLPMPCSRQLDFGLRAWLSGWEVRIQPEVKVAVTPEPAAPNLSVESSSDAEELRQYTRAALTLKYLTNPERRRSCYQPNPRIDGLVSQRAAYLHRSRERFLAHAIHDDDWLFYKFLIPEPPVSLGENC